MAGRRRWVVLGVAAAAVTFASLALLTALSTRPLRSTDERQHAAYALEVARGRLPTLNTPVAVVPALAEPAAKACRSPAGTAEPGRAAVSVRRAPRITCTPDAQPGLFIYTANHPPLFYVLEAAPLRIGEAAGAPLGGVIAGRIVNIGVGVAGLVATAWLVGLLFPRRPDLVVATAGLTGLCGLYIAVSGQVYNDTLAVATITAALAAAVTIAVRGPSWPRLVVVCLATVAAAASRAAGLEAAVAIVPAVGIAVGLHRAAATRAGGRRPWWRSALEGAGASAAVAGTVAAGIGWFYLRNRGLYGDLTGARVVQRMFAVPPTPWAVALRSGDFWWWIYRGFWGRSALVTGTVGQVVTACLVAVPAGLVLAGVRWAINAWPVRGRPRVTGRTVAWALVAVQVGIVVATLLGYVDSGGAWFARYLLPALPVGALVFAVALAALPLARFGLPATAAYASLAWANLVMTGRGLAWHQAGSLPPDTLGRLRTSLARNHVDHPRLVLWTLLATLAAGVAGLAVAGGRLGYGSVPRWPRPGRGAGASRPAAPAPPTTADL